MVRQTAFALLLIGMWSCTPSNEFIPVVKVGDNLVSRPELMSDTLSKNIVQVLTYYNEAWKLEGGRLLVSQDDRELLWNYTTKAMDRDWLSAHRPDQHK
jgi:hypothetical protein